MTKKTKSKIINENRRILDTTIPKYLEKLKANNEQLNLELQKWENIHPNCNNANNLEHHLLSLQSELDEWRNLIPGCQTIAKARTYLRRQTNKQATVQSAHNRDWDLYYGEFKEDMAIEGKTVYQFANLEEFQAQKDHIIDIIFDPNKNAFEKVGHDHEYHFIKFFKYKYNHGIDDEDVSIQSIFDNQLVKL